MKKVNSEEEDNFPEDILAEDIPRTYVSRRQQHFGIADEKSSTNGEIVDAPKMRKFHQSNPLRNLHGHPSSSESQPRPPSTPFWTRLASVDNAGASVIDTNAVGPGSTKEETDCHLDLGSRPTFITDAEPTETIGAVGRTCAQQFAANLAPEEKEEEKEEEGVLSSSITRHGAVAIPAISDLGTTPTEQADPEAALEAVTVDEERRREEPGLAVAALIVDEPNNNTVDAERVAIAVPLSTDEWWRQRRYQICLMLVLLVVIGGAITVGLTASSTQSETASSSTTNDPPSFAPTASLSPSMVPTTIRQGDIIDDLAVLTPRQILLNTSTPQNAAMRWLIQHDKNTNATMMASEIGSSPKFLQRYALAVLYFTTGGDWSWERSLSFLTNQDECSWNDGLGEGVTACDDEDMVTGLVFGTNNTMVGFLPEEIQALTALESFQLYENSLYGSIPAVPWLSLTNLRLLAIENTNLKGTIPTELGLLTKLTILSVSSNELTGSIPATLGKLTLLEELYVSNNRLSGTLPSELGSLSSSLFSLVASSNDLNGTVPLEYSNLSVLSVMYLHVNSLSGNAEHLCEIPTLTASILDCYSDHRFVPATTRVDAEIVCPCCSRCCRDLQAPSESPTFCVVCAFSENYCN